MFKKRFALAAICALALSAFAIAAPVDLERTELVMASNVLVDSEAVTGLDVSIQSFEAVFELSSSEAELFIWEAHPSAKLAFAPFALKLAAPLSEVGWNNFNLRF